MQRRSIIHCLGVVVMLGAASCSSSGESSTSPTTNDLPATTSVLTTTAATTSAPTTAPPITPAPTTVPPPPPVATTSTCPGGAPTTLTCLTVAVPVDPAAPDGKSVNLAVTVRRANPSDWTAPVLSILGATPSYPWTDPKAADVFPGHDMIWIDQRGVGRSVGVTDCPELPTYVAEIRMARLGAAALAAFSDCFARAEQSVVPFASMFDHRIVAADIGIVRQALGISAWALYAGGAGADIALHLVDQDPASVSAIVSRTPMAVGAGLSPNNLAAAFDRFATDCAAAPTCAASGDLQQALAKAYARLATPVTTKTTEIGTGVPILLDQRLLLDALQSIGNLSVVNNVPLLLPGAVDGSTDEAVATNYANAHEDPFAWAFVLRCQSVDYAWPGLVTTANDQAGIFAGYTLKPLCDAIGPLPQYSPRADPTSDVPVLAVLPSYDTRSSVTTAKQVFSGFPNVTIVEVPRIVDPLQQLTDCFYATANAFLAAPDAQLDASCLTAPAISTLT